VTNPAQYSTPALSNNLRGAAFMVALVCSLTTVALQPVQAQTYTVIHNFTGGQDGANPGTGVTVDPSNNLYGTTNAGGAHNYGAVFKLAHERSNWILTPLNFATTGGGGYGGLTIGPNGTLYGTMLSGGGGGCMGAGCGTVFNLSPPARACASILCTWIPNTLYGQ
jgi:uncharacterized repeat protein (TIGR03803 family)